MVVIDLWPTLKFELDTDMLEEYVGREGKDINSFRGEARKAVIKAVRRAEELEAGRRERRVYLIECRVDDTWSYPARTKEPAVRLDGKLTVVKLKCYKRGVGEEDGWFLVVGKEALAFSKCDDNEGKCVAVMRQGFRDMLVNLKKMKENQ